MFRGEHFFLSNMYPVEVVLPAERVQARDGTWHDAPALPCPSTENAYMAWKLADPALRARVAEMEPKASKAFLKGTALTHYRADYDDLGRARIMLALGGQKFDPAHPAALAERLLDTDVATLVEGNTWGDSFFGLCLRTGVGLNMLGRIHMTHRDRLRVARGLEPVAPPDKPYLPDDVLAP